MPEMMVEFETYCVCGEAICSNVEIDKYHGRFRGNVLIVEPCIKCLNKANDDGYNQAISEKDF